MKTPNFRYGRSNEVTDLKPSFLDEWKRMGEVGQYLAGRFMGFDKNELMEKRQWTRAQADEYELKASVWLAKNRRKK